MEDDSEAAHMASDVGMASTTRKRMKKDTISLGNKEGNFAERLVDPPENEKCLDERAQGFHIEHYLLRSSSSQLV